MKKVVYFILVLVVSVIPMNTNAQRGCCSHHGGVVGCSPSGKQVCADGTLSPSCTCSGGSTNSSSSSATTRSYQQPSYIYGCTDSSAINYNASATKDDGSCIAKREGCMDTNAINYDSTANTADESCQYKKNIVAKEKMKYTTNYKSNSNMLKDQRKKTVAGEVGEKEVTYDAVVDKDGNIISKKKINEKVIIEPVNQVIEIGTKESDSSVGFIWIVSLIISFIYAFKNKNSNLLLNKISHQKKELKILLYILYIILVIPVFIDIVIIITNIVKKYQLKQ